MNTSKRILSVAVLIASSLSMMNVSHAVLYNGDAFFPGNGLPDVTIGNLPYWEEEAVSTLGYTNASQTARTKYDQAADADIDFYRVTNGNSAAVRVFAGDFGYSGWFGRIYPFDAYGNSKTEFDAWAYVNMQYNDFYMDYKGFDEANRTYNAIHEWGHALSLIHQDSQSVMLEGKYSLTAPTLVDYSNLNYMY